MGFTKEEKFLKEKNIKPTAMRLLVLQYLFASNEALSLGAIETALPYSDKSTIFRSLKTFEENGLVHTIHEGSVTKYAVCGSACNPDFHIDKHPHFHCTQCDITICLETEVLPVINLPHNYTVSSQEFIIHGLCEKCNLIASNRM